MAPLDDPNVYVYCRRVNINLPQGRVILQIPCHWSMILLPPHRQPCLQICIPLPVTGAGSSATAFV